MPAWGSPTTPSRPSPRRPPQGSITAISPRCSMRRGIGGTSLWGRVFAYSAVMPGLDPGIHQSLKRLAKRMDCRERRQVYVVCARQTTMPGNDDSPLLHAQRHEAQFALGVGHQQQDGFLAVLLQLIDALLDVGGVGHRLLRHLDDHLAGAQAFIGGVGGAVDIGDDNALDAVLDLVTGAQILAQGCEFQAQRLLRDRFLRGLGLRLGGRLHRLVAILEAAERDFAGFLRALADDDDIDLLADRGVGHDARQVLRFLDVLAVELDDDIARLDAGGLRRALVLDAGDQGAARRLDAEAFGDLVGDLLDADAEPAAAELAELPQRIDHAGDGLRRHRKADADRAARRRDDQRVDPDHFAVEIEQRTAAIAAVDGGVGLDVVVVGA